MIKKSVVIKAKRLNIKKLDYITVLLFTLLVCGVIIGVHFVVNLDENIAKGLLKLLNSYLSAKKENNVFTLFSSNAAVFLIMLIGCMIFGLCAVGIPFIIFVPAFSGVMMGGIVTLFYINFQLTGLGYCALINIPSFAIISATLLKACKESLFVSVNILGLLNGSINKSEKNILKKYLIKYGVFGILIILSSFVSSILFKIFSNLFVFIQ